MLIRISLIIAILGGIAAIVLGNVQLRTHIKGIIQEREDERAAKVQALADLSKTRKDLTATQQKLSQEETAHSDTKNRLMQANNRVTQLEKDNADLTESLETTRQNLTTSNQQLAAWNALGIPVDQVRAVIEQNKEYRFALEALNQEKNVLSYNNKKLRAELAKYIGPEEPVVEMPTGLKGQVTAVDPKWDFVVINVGEKDGVLPDGVFLVNRDGRLVGKVKVATVQPKRAIANVMPGWRLSDIMEGDEVLY
jgi:cell shape-determining protein MreC